MVSGSDGGITDILCRIQVDWCQSVVKTQQSQTHIDDVCVCVCVCVRACVNECVCACVCVHMHMYKLVHI